ncbi:ribonuclease H2, subunit B [Mycena amicta]|nr:ribonuclease H2, subunit B [Mycena amicta]
MATHLAVLPDTLSLPSTRFLTLLHPRTELPTLFLAADNILEAQSVSPTNARSWFIDQEVVSDGKLLVFTPVDPAFLLIPVLQSVYPENSPGMFRPADEIFEDAATNLEQSSEPSTSIRKEDVLYFASMECCRRALKRVCDVKEISDDIVVYRFSREQVVQYLRTKVERLSTPETTELSRTLVRNLAKDGLLEDGKEELLKVGRVRAACDLVGQYIPPALRTALTASYDFSALDTHFRSIEEEQESLMVQRPSKKKSAPAPTDKKRKQSSSQGVEKLKKVKTTGMAKMSTFFTKKVPA